MRVAGCEKATKILAQRSKAEDGKLRKLFALASDPWELYDIEADRTETHNLAGAQPEVVAGMGKLCDGWAAEVGAASPKDAHVSQMELPEGLVAD